MVDCLWAVEHVGAFFGAIATPQERTHMDRLRTTMARQIAEAASTCQQQRTGHMPQSVTVALDAGHDAGWAAPVTSPAAQAARKELP